jgi:hypothetical protein
VTELIMLRPVKVNRCTVAFRMDTQLYRKNSAKSNFASNLLGVVCHVHYPAFEKVTNLLRMCLMDHVGFVFLTVKNRSRKFLCYGLVKMSELLTASRDD